MADMIKFYKGLVETLPATGTNGALYITTDEGGIYLGTGTGMKRLGDFVQVADVASLPAKAHENCLYYCVAENILAKWNGAEWKQVNKQPTTEELKTLLGLGSMAYKSEVVEGDLNAELAAKINASAEGNHSHSNKAELDKIADGDVAKWNAAEQNAKDHADGLAEAIQNGETINDFAGVEAEFGKVVYAEDGKSLIADTEIARLAAMSDGANKVEKSETNGNIKVDGAEVVVYTHPEKHAIADVTGLQDALDGLQAKGDYAAEEHTHTKDEITDFDHTHVAADITDLDDTINGYNYATKTEAQGYADAKDDAIAAAKKAGDDAQKTIDEYKTSNDAALALKADKSVVDAMYTNEQIDGFIAEAKKHADDNDADTKYGIAYDSENKKIKLVEGGTEVEIDATDFIKDGMIETVALSEDGLNLVITWNTDSDKGENNVTTIPLTGLVDVYTGVDGTTVTVTVSSDDKISAEVKTGSIKDGHIASDAAIAKSKLAADVQASLGKADTALQAHQDISHLAEKTQVATDIATAKGEAISAAETKAGELDAALKTELQGEIDGDVKAAIDAEVLRANGAYDAKGAAEDAQAAAEATAAGALATARTEITAEIDADVKALADGQVKTNTEAIATLTGKVYTKEEVDAAVAEAVNGATEWGSF